MADKLGNMVAHVSNPSTWGVKAGRSGVQNHLWLQSKSEVILKYRGLMHHKKTQRGWCEDTRIVGRNYSGVNIQEKKMYLVGF